MSTQVYGERSGWVTVAAVMMFAIAFVRIITASEALNDVKSAADSLASTVTSTLAGPDCTS